MNQMVEALWAEGMLGEPFEYENAKAKVAQTLDIFKQRSYQAATKEDMEAADHYASQ